MRPFAPRSTIGPIAVALLALVAVGCGGSPDEPTDAGAPDETSVPPPDDASQGADAVQGLDASAQDASSAVDAGGAVDSPADASADARYADASDATARPSDAGPDASTDDAADATSVDAADATVEPSDAATVDAASDAGPPDATVDDASTGLDAGPADAGADGSAPDDAAVPDAAGDDAATPEGGTGDDASASDGAAADVAAETSAPVIVHFVPGVSVRTLAGSDVAGEQDGVGSAATFDNPTGLALDHDGNLVVVDYDGWTVRLVTPGGSVTTIAASALFGRPFAAAVADDGTYFVSTDDDPNDAGLKTATSGAVWSVLSDGGLASPVPIATSLARPRGLTAGTNGGLFVVSRYGNLVGALDVGSNALRFLAGGGDAGFADGVGAQAAFSSPVGAVRLSDGSFAVADAANSAIRVVQTDGTVTTLAGDGTPGMIDGPCASARFGSPRDVALDGFGNVYVTDGANQRVRRLRNVGDVAGCLVETLAGSGVAGFADGPGEQAAFFGEEGIDVTPDGTTVYIADGDLGSAAPYHRVRTVQVPSVDGGP